MREGHWRVIMSLDYLTSSGCNAKALRRGNMCPKGAGATNPDFETPCLETIKDFVDTRRAVLAAKSGPVCVPDDVFSCFLSGDDVTIRYPIKPESGTNPSLARARSDPEYTAPSVATEEADADGLQFLQGVPDAPAKVAHGLSMEFLFSTLMA